MSERHHNFKHGQARPQFRGPTYRSWECMRSRCRNKNNPDFHNYGGRGIEVCHRWDQFANFLADMGERPCGMTLDRVDVDGNYEPGNCRWASNQAQQRNKRNGTKIPYNGAIYSLRELSEMTGQPYQRLQERIVQRGWSAERAVSTPPRVWSSQLELAV